MSIQGPGSWHLLELVADFSHDISFVEVPGRTAAVDGRFGHTAAGVVLIESQEVFRAVHRTGLGVAVTDGQAQPVPSIRTLRRPQGQGRSLRHGLAPQSAVAKRQDSRQGGTTPVKPEPYSSRGLVSLKNTTGAPCPCPAVALHGLGAGRAAPLIPTPPCPRAQGVGRPLPAAAQSPGGRHERARRRGLPLRREGDASSRSRHFFG